MDLEELIQRFRIASRELFNNYFAVGTPGSDESWAWEERFSWVQKILFQKMVIEPGSLKDNDYGEPNPEIRVEPKNSSVPAQINRDIQSGYWDFPLQEISNAADLSFVEFFDWSQVEYRHNKYVIVRIESWPAHPEVHGKHALIEADYLDFRAVIPDGREPRGFFPSRLRKKNDGEVS